MEKMDFYRDMLNNEREETGIYLYKGEVVPVNPILIDPYLFVGFMEANQYSGQITLEQIKKRYHRYGLKDIPRREKAVEWLVDNFYIFNESFANMSDERAKEIIVAFTWWEETADVSDEDIIAFRERGMKVDEQLEEGKMTTFNPSSAVDYSMINKEGYIKLKTDIMERMPFQGKLKSVRAAQLFVYLALRSTWQNVKKVPAFELDYSTKERGHTVKTYKGEVLVGRTQVAEQLKMSNTTADLLTKALVEAQALYSRKVKWGRSVIYAIPELKKPSKEKKKKRRKA